MKKHPNAVEGNEWDGVPESEQNIWQRLARRTNGKLTPANLVTSLGIACVAYGALNFVQGNRVAGAIEIGIGFGLDGLDGFTAKVTKTRGEIGAKYDAISDKIKMAAGIGIVCMTGGAVEIVSAGVVGVQQSVNVVANLIAERRGRKPHTNNDGRNAMLAQAGGVTAMALGHGLEPNAISDALEYGGAVAAMVGTAYPGGRATVDYIRTAFGPAEKVAA